MARIKANISEEELSLYSFDSPDNAVLNVSSSTSFAILSISSNPWPIVLPFAPRTLEDIKGFCAVKTTEDIAAQDYILTPGRYVGIEDKEEDDEPFDEKMTRLTSELSQMFTKSHELEEEIRKKLGAIGYEI